MAEPASVSAVAKLVAELAQIGYKAWRDSQKAKEKLVVILLHVQDELNRNYKALQDASNGSRSEWLETRIYETAIEAISQALHDAPSVLDPLRRAYQMITLGLQTRLRQGQWDEASSELMQLWRLIGQASYAVDTWFDREHLVPSKFSREECAFLGPHQLTGGWPRAEKLRLLKTWQQFGDAWASDHSREITLHELALSSVYAEPGREIDFRNDALTRHGPLHSFELVDGICELWLEPSLRLLYWRAPWGLVLIDVVQLSGRDEDGWTPKWYVQRARCRVRSRESMATS